MTGYSDREFGEMAADLRYLKECCQKAVTKDDIKPLAERIEKMEKEQDAAKTRSLATLTTVIVLLIGTIVNLVLYYAK